MISNKNNKELINQVLENFVMTGIAQLKDSLETHFNQLMIAEREDHICAAKFK